MFELYIHIIYKMMISIHKSHSSAFYSSKTVIRYKNKYKFGMPQKEVQAQTLPFLGVKRHLCFPRERFICWKMRVDVQLIDEEKRIKEQDDRNKETLFLRVEENARVEDEDGKKENGGENMKKERNWILPKSSLSQS